MYFRVFLILAIGAGLSILQALQNHPFLIPSKDFWLQFFYIFLSSIVTLLGVDYFMSHEEERKWRGVKNYVGQKFNQFSQNLSDALRNVFGYGPTEGVDPTQGELIFAQMNNQLFLKEKLQNLDASKMDSLDQAVNAAQLELRDTINQYGRWMPAEIALLIFNIDDNIRTLKSNISVYKFFAFPAEGRQAGQPQLIQLLLDEMTKSMNSLITNILSYKNISMKTK